MKGNDERNSDAKDVEVSLIKGDVKEVERKRDVVAVEEPLHILLMENTMLRFSAR